MGAPLTSESNYLQRQPGSTASTESKALSRPLANRHCRAATPKTPNPATLAKADRAGDAKRALAGTVAQAHDYYTPATCVEKDPPPAAAEGREAGSISTLVTRDKQVVQTGARQAVEIHVTSHDGVPRVHVKFRRDVDGITITKGALGLNLDRACAVRDALTTAIASAEAGHAARERGR